jgi:hypothetical protein
MARSAGSPASKRPRELVGSLAGVRPWLSRAREFLSGTEITGRLSARLEQEGWQSGACGAVISLAFRLQTATAAAPLFVILVSAEWIYL